MKIEDVKQLPTFCAIQKTLFKIQKTNNLVFFQFLQKDYLENYLGRWEQQVSETPGLSKEGKSCLLRMLGWKIKGNLYFFRYIRGEGLESFKKAEIKLFNLSKNF